MKKLQKIDLYVIPLIFAAISSIILRTYALLTSFERDILHFDNKIAIGFATGIVVIAVIGFLTYLFLGEKETDLIAKSGNAASYIPAGIVGVALLFMGVKNLMLGLEKGIYTDERIPPMLIISAVLALLSIFSFFISVFVEKNESLFKAAFSLSIVLFLALYSAILYFNTNTHPNNSPNKIVDEMAYIFSAIFFLFEARIPLGRAKWRPYVAFGLIATLLTAYSAIPSIVVYAIDGYTVSESLFESALSITLSILIFSKILQTRGLTVNEESSAAQSIVMMSKMREEEIENRHKLSHANINKEENNDTQDASNYTFDIPYVEPGSDLGSNDATLDISKSE